ncbi:MAG: orotate phosphoribosyltransferase [Pseudomonadota bacterium]
MDSYKADFIEFALAREVLLFGEFTLKSGRRSPYFFNAGQFNTGAGLARLGAFYADALMASGIAFDMLFGPAYKGIPLVSALSTQLHALHDRDLPWSFNRKEAKDHGEAGIIVGAPIAGRVLIVDDVISAGTSARESIEIIDAAGGEPCALAIALDRQERGQGELSAVQEVRQNLGLEVVPIVTMIDLITFMQTHAGYAEHLERMEAYRAQYGVA